MISEIEKCKRPLPYERKPTGFFDLPFPRIVLLLTFLAQLVATDTARACSCARQNEIGFPHASTDSHPAHLPSNARGVLFLSASEVHVVAGDGENLLVDTMPVPLSATMFTISSGKSAKAIPAEVEPVHIQHGDGIESQPHYFYSRNAAIYQCTQFQIETACQSAHIDPEKKDWLKKLIAAGQVKDVSKNMAASSSLYRVRPAGGFVKGEKYTISYRGETNNSYPGKIDVQIDEPLTTQNLAGARIEWSGDPTRVEISVPRGGVCSAEMPVTAQKLHYLIPDALLPYQDAIVYFTEQKYRAGGFAPYDTPVDTFMPWAYRDSMCSRVPFGSSILGAGKEMVYSTCEEDGKKPASSFVRGEVGVLEMSDRVYQTPAVEVKFGNANTGSCSGGSSFEQTLRGNDSQKVEAQICHLAYSGYGARGLNAPHTLRLLEPYVQSRGAATRQCAVTAALALYAELNVDSNFGPGGREVPALEKEVQDMLVDKAYEQRILNSIIVGFSDKDENGRDRAHQQFEQFVRIFWPEQGSSKAYVFNNSALFDMVMQKAKVMLSSNDSRERQLAMQTYLYLGPSARSVLPALLDMAKRDASQAPGLPMTLTYVGPGDPRVFDELISMMNRHVPDAASTLARISNGKETVAFDAIVADLKMDDDYSLELINALGSMDRTANRAGPILMKYARDSTSEKTRAAALTALVATGDRSPQLLQQICIFLEPPGHSIQGNTSVRDENQRDAIISLIKSFGAGGQAALPVLKRVMKEKISSLAKRRLREIFDQWQMPASEKAALLARLEKIPDSG